MPRYLSRRHKRLMNESEQALWDAIAGKPTRHSNIAKYVLNDHKTHLTWESRHAELIRPVAEQNKRTPQVFALREIELQLVHKRALIDYISTNKLQGKERERMFSAIYGPRDTVDAILTEHRQYTMAVSSNFSTNHLIDVMYDPIGMRMLRRYKQLYTDYFDLYGLVIRTEDVDVTDEIIPLMREARNKLDTQRMRIRTEQPDNSFADFDRQALLAYSGRQPILEYMVG